MYKKAKHGKSRLDTTRQKSKKQQVLLPVKAFASDYGETNSVTPFSKVEGTNEGPVREPTTLFINSGGQKNLFAPPVRQREENGDQFGAAAFADRGYNMDASLMNSDLVYNYENEMHAEDDNSQRENANANQHFAFSSDRGEESPYADWGNAVDENHVTENQESVPESSWSNINNYENNALEDTADMSRVALAKLRELDRSPYVFDQHQATMEPPRYSPLVERFESSKALERDRAAKKESETDSKDRKISKQIEIHNKTQVIDNEAREAKKEKFEYKKMVKSAELAANLAEAAHTLTKLVRKLTSREAIINQDQRYGKDGHEKAQSNVSHRDLLKP